MSAAVKPAGPVADGTGMPPPPLRLMADVVRAARRRLSPGADDRRWLARRYEAFVGRRPDLRNPTGFREKLLWLNLHHRDPLVPRLTDKLTARDVVAERVGPGVLADLLGVWDRPRRIPFDRLRQPCVLKVTSGSGWNVFCPDPAALDVPAAIAALDAWAGQDYGHRYREWYYRRLAPRVIAERLMVDPRHGRSPDGLKVHCFNGQPRLVQVCVDRRGDRRLECFDPDWRVLELGLNGPYRAPAPPARPDGLDDVLSVARRLSAGFPYVRVDLYRHGGRTVFGGMTWFPSAGNLPMDDPATDALLGSWLVLPEPNRAGRGRHCRFGSPPPTAPRPEPARDGFER